MVPAIERGTRTRDLIAMALQQMWLVNEGAFAKKLELKKAAVVRFRESGAKLPSTWAAAARDDMHGRIVPAAIAASWC